MTEDEIATLESLADDARAEGKVVVLSPDTIEHIVRRIRFERSYIDAAIAGFSGCVSPSLAQQLKNAIAFAREQAARS